MRRSRSEIRESIKQQVKLELDREEDKNWTSFTQGDVSPEESISQLAFIVLTGGEV